MSVGSCRNLQGTKSVCGLPLSIYIFSKSQWLTCWPQDIITVLFYKTRIVWIQVSLMVFAATFISSSTSTRPELAVGLMAEDSNRDALAGPGALWGALRALLPRSKEDLRLDLSESVERSVVVLLQQAADLFYGGRRSECLQTSEVVLDYSWEKLNTGLWQDVDKDWRRVYAFGCLLKAVCLCEAPGDATTVAAALRVCDMGLLMGAAIFDDILIKVAAVLQAHLLPGKRPAHGPAPEQPRFKVSWWDCPRPHLTTQQPCFSGSDKSPLWLKIASPSTGK